MKTPILKIRGLKVAYSRSNQGKNKFIERFIYKTKHTDLILKNINLTVHDKEILGLVGESGCGKSVTVKSIFGMVNFFPGIISGQIEYYQKNGEKIQLLDHDDRKNGNSNGVLSELIEYKELVHGQNDIGEVNGDNPGHKWIYDDNLFFEKIPTNETCNSKHVFRILNRRHDLYTNQSQEIENVFKRHKEKGTVLAGKEISIILQDPLTFLNPYWSIKTQIENLYNLFSVVKKKSGIKGLGSIAHWQSTKKILKDLRINTDEFLNKIPGELSGGQSQRVMIVLSRMSDPELLIADEPTTGLDVTLKKRVVDYFRERKKSMVFISHDLNMVRMVSDRINVMYNGEIVENCDSNTFKSGFTHHPFTEKLVSVFYSDYADYIEHELPSKDELYNYHGCTFALQGCPYVRDICKNINPPAIDVESQEFITDDETDKQWAKCWKFLDEK